jgi:hypothetical protein
MKEGFRALINYYLPFKDVTRDDICSTAMEPNRLGIDSIFGEQG